MANGASKGRDDQYIVTFVNDSTQSGSVCIYQQTPEPADPSVWCLAWLVMRVTPTTAVSIRWTLDYGFVWGQTGTLAPGIRFSASQQRDADLVTRNQVNFAQDSSGSFTFDDPTQGPTPEILVIQQGNFVPPAPADEVSVGIGMAGHGTFVRQAQPNVAAFFTPHPQYWICFGQYTQGEVIDVNQMTNAQELPFTTGIFAITATLHADNTWTIVPTFQANADFLEAH